MEIDVLCVVPDEEVFAQIRVNSESCRKWAKIIDAHDGVAVLVGGGPSVQRKIEAIKYRQGQGQKVFALNGVCKLLNDNGIIPDYQVLLDPQEFLTAYIGEAKEYLVASQCHPSVFASVPDPTLWHFAGEGHEENIPEYDDDFCLVGGSITVGLTSMCLVYTVGYRMLHCYGYDSSYEENRTHAYPMPVFPIEQIAHLPVAGEKVCITTGGKKFISTLCLTKQAQNFPNLCDDLMDLGCTITLDCDGLLWAITQQNLIAAQAA